MRVSFLCPSCEGSLTAGSDNLAPDCPHCGARIRLRGQHAPGEGTPVERCVVCGSEAMYLQKDFNRNLGVAIVAAGALVMVWSFWWGLAALVALAGVDLLLYRLLPTVTVCYACKSVYRETPPNPRHEGYELSVDEAFEGTGEAPPVEAPGGTPGAAP